MFLHMYVHVLYTQEVHKSVVKDKNSNHGAGGRGEKEREKERDEKE